MMPNPHFWCRCSSSTKASKQGDKQESQPKDAQERILAVSDVTRHEELVKRTPSTAQASGHSAANVFVQVGRCKHICYICCIILHVATCLPCSLPQMTHNTSDKVMCLLDQCMTGTLCCTGHAALLDLSSGHVPACLETYESMLPG